MAKLNVIYRMKDDEKDYFKGKTYYTISFENGNTEISIAPEETRKLADIVHDIEKELQNKFYLQENKGFELDDVTKAVIELEKEQEDRIDNVVYNFCKNNYQKVLEGKTTLDYLINVLEKEGVANA